MIHKMTGEIENGFFMEDGYSTRVDIVPYRGGDNRMIFIEMGSPQATRNDPQMVIRGKVTVCLNDATGRYEVTNSIEILSGVDVPESAMPFFGAMTQNMDRLVKSATEVIRVLYGDEGQGPSLERFGEAVRNRQVRRHSDLAAIVLGTLPVNEEFSSNNVYLEPTFNPIMVEAFDTFNKEHPIARVWAHIRHRRGMPAI